MREFKKLLLKMKNIFKRENKKLKSIDVIKKASTNMNRTKTQKYQIEPEEDEKRALSNEKFREEYDFYRIDKVGKEAARLDRYNLRKDSNNPRKLREPLQIGEKVLVSSERLKKKGALGRLYKATAQNKSCFSKKTFIIKKRAVTTSDDWYYWVSEENSDLVNKRRYIRQELFALNDQWR